MFELPDFKNMIQNLEVSNKFLLPLQAHKLGHKKTIEDDIERLKLRIHGELTYTQINAQTVDSILNTIVKLAECDSLDYESLCKLIDLASKTNRTNYF